MFSDWLSGKGGQAATFPGDALSSDTLSDDEIAALMYDPKAGLSSLGTFYDNPKVTQLLADAKDSPAELSARGEAQWLAYYKEQTEKKERLDPENEKVKEALKDFADAKTRERLAKYFRTGKLHGVLAFKAG